MHNNILKKFNKTYIPVIPISYFSKNCRIVVPKNVPCFLDYYSLYSYRFWNFY